MKETLENLILNQLDLTVYGEDKNAVEQKKIVDDKCKEGDESDCSEE